MLDTVIRGGVSAYYQRSAGGANYGGKGWLAGDSMAPVRGGDGAARESLSSGGSSFAKIIGKLLIEADQPPQS